MKTLIRKREVEHCISTSLGVFMACLEELFFKVEVERRKSYIYCCMAFFE